MDQNSPETKTTTERPPCGKCGSCIDAAALRARARELLESADYYEALCMQKAATRIANEVLGGFARVIRRKKKAVPAGMMSADEAADRPSEG